MKTAHTIEYLLDANLDLLSDGRRLLNSLKDDDYSRVVVPPHRAGGHIRHILEFYGCFLDGAASGRIDYDSRIRDLRVETNRLAAIDRIVDIQARLCRIEGDTSLLVRAEDSEEEDSWMSSSVARELQVLRSHTIHHYALAALTLQAAGLHVDRDFGMAPSTLRHRAKAAVCVQ